MLPARWEDIFSFHERLKTKITDIEKLNHVAQKFGGSIQIPSFLIVNKLLNAAIRSGEYKPFIEKLQLSPMEEWMKKTPEDFVSELQRFHTTANVGHARGRRASVLSLGESP